jgi:hypothetical protein
VGVWVVVRAGLLIVLTIVELVLIEPHTSAEQNPKQLGAAQPLL